MARALKIPLDKDSAVSGLWDQPKGAAHAAIALAHGAGAGMSHRSMEALAAGLNARGIAMLRYNFPYMERGSKRVDAPAIAHKAVRAAVAVAREHAGALPLFAGGRSYGGRMTSQTEAKEHLDGVRGLVFFAFPLHPAGAPGHERAAHLKGVAVPMLFLSGTRDALAELSLLKPMVKGLRAQAKLVLAEDADHSFHVPAKSGRKDGEILDMLLDRAVEWMERCA